MKYSLLFIIFLFSCGNSTENNEKTLKKNIAIVTNQSSGYLTMIDLETYEKTEYNLSEKLQAYKDSGKEIDETFIQNPRPHYVQTSSGGKYIYVVFTARVGALVKLNAEFDVVKFTEIKNTTFPAHLQLTKDNKEIFVSTWTTNMMMGGDGSSGENNYILHYNSDLEEIGRYATPAGAHGIKLTPDESKLVVGHDLSDFISIFEITKLKTGNNPLETATKLTDTATVKGGALNTKYSPTQLGVTPDGQFAFFSCKVSSQLMIYDLVKSKILGYYDLGAGKAPYSIEIGPKESFTSAEKKFLYVNYKGTGNVGRFELNFTTSAVDKMLTPQGELQLLSTEQARPHGMDITDNGKRMVVSSEFIMGTTKAHTFIVDLENWSLLKTIETKPESRGLCIYPSIGN